MFSRGTRIGGKNLPILNFFLQNTSTLTLIKINFVKKKKDERKLESSRNQNDKE